MTVASLLVKHEASYARATRHPFLVAVRDGSLPEQAFDTWLAQDYLFVIDLMRFQARLTTRAAASALPVLTGGAAALAEELAWFERHASARGVDLNATPLAATIAYRELLGRLDDASFSAAMTALWALERAYLDAWSFAAPGADPYREFVEHWTSPEFAAYVDALRDAADESPDDTLLGEVIEAEERFWDMAYGPRS
jgi:formylaminopyrimidine deformylase / aminopyrimidine aminohydrolase